MHDQLLEIRIEPLGEALTLGWRTAGAASLAAPALRRACRCAACERARRDGREAPIGEQIRITRVTPMGSNAINIGFSDGHDHGIYPFAYLDLLSRPGSA